MPMMRGAIFDVDGTLLDSMPIWEDAASRCLRQRGKEPEEDLGKKLFSMSMRQGALYVKEKYGLTETIEKIIDSVNETVMDFYSLEVCLKPGVREILESLKDKNIPAVAATASDRILIEKAFSHLKISHYFKKIFTVSETGKGKDAPDIFFTAARELEASPEHIFVFEDGLYAAKTAAAAGFRVVGVYDKYSEAEQEELEKTVEIYIGKKWNINDFWRFYK